MVTAFIILFLCVSAVLAEIALRRMWVERRRNRRGTDFKAPPSRTHFQAWLDTLNEPTAQANSLSAAARKTSPIPESAPPIPLKLHPTGPAFVGEVGNWPTIMHSGNGGYVIKAAHETPRRENWPGRAAVPTTIVVLPIFAVLWAGGWPELIEAIVASICFGWFSKKAIWPEVFKKRLTIRIEDGRASWNGPFGATGGLGPDEEYVAQEFAPHRLAGEQARVNATIDRNARHSNFAPPLPVAFLAASELVVTTGRMRQRQVVAEIAYDAIGDQVHALNAAIDIALRENRRAVREAKQKESTPVYRTLLQGRDVG